MVGTYLPQLSSFATYSDLVPIVLFLLLGACLAGRSTAVLLLLGGAIQFGVDAERVITSRISAEYVGDSIMTEVRVVGFPRRRGESVNFVGEVIDSPWVPARIRVSWYTPPHEIRPGERWRLELRLKRPRATSNPGIFDYEALLFRQQIAATAFVVNSHRNQRLRTGELGHVDRVRLHVVDRVVAAVREPDRAAVLIAISVGARHLVSQEQWQRYAQTGISHLMAISGLHVGMLVAVAYLLTAMGIALAGASKHLHRASTVVAFASAVVYALLSGIAIPAQRATLMIGLAATAIVVARQVRPFRIIAITSAVIAGTFPFSTMSPGFVLSFLAVLVLIWLARQSFGLRAQTVLQRRLSAPGRLLRIQLALLCGLLPVTVLFFDRVALSSPLVNLVAVPVFSIITVPFTMLGLLLDGPASGAGDVLLGLASQSLGVLEGLIDFALRLPIPADTLPALDRRFAVFLVLPITWAVLPAGWPGRNLAWLAAAVVVTVEPARPEPGCAEMTVLDVGQGLAVAVQTRSASLLYDTGPAYFTGGSAAESIILPYLRNRGVESLNQLVVTHDDLDHTGGFATIVRALDVRRIHVGDGAGRGWLTSPCVAGTTWMHDGVRFEFVHPRGDSAWVGNDASCVLLVSVGSNRVLLGGDIEKAAEIELLRAGALQRADVVIVPHHGSRTSSTRQFVAALRPALAVISAGFGNRWGQPHPEVVDRWRASGATVLTTADSGAISFTVCEQGGVRQLARHRDLRRRLWHE